MKYLWLSESGVKNSSGEARSPNMETSGDFISSAYNIKLMEIPQHDSPKKVKRFRSAFTTDQVNYLEKQFKKFPYVGNAHRKEVAIALNIPERAVKIWFQNRRMKEKKETTTKEFDDEQGTRSSLEFSKKQLNNAIVTSANEQQPRSLPILTDMSQATCNLKVITNDSACNIMSGQLVQDVDIKNSRVNIAPKSVITTGKVIHPPTVFTNSKNSPSECNTSPEFSINLCKKYKNEYFSKQSYVGPTYKQEVIDIKQNPGHQSMSPVPQMIPEDLSPSRKTSLPTMVQQQTPAMNAPNNSGYISLVPTVSPFYTQPYISASGVIWKPVSVMPVLSSSSSPMSAPNNSMLNMTSVQKDVTKRCCNCDCHVKPQPYNFQQQSPSPQYIITALPFQNPSS